jgi:hypothetical protein
VAVRAWRSESDGQRVMARPRECGGWAPRVPLTEYRGGELEGVICHVCLVVFLLALAVLVRSCGGGAGSNNVERRTSMDQDTYKIRPALRAASPAWPPRAD